MTRASNRPLAICPWFYRALVRAFPHEFKNAYGKELVQMTEDAIEVRTGPRSPRDRKGW